MADHTIDKFTFGGENYILQDNVTEFKTINSSSIKGSGNITTPDTKVTVAAASSGTTYYPILATGTGTATRQIDTGGLGYTFTSGLASLCIGNSTKAGNIVVTTGTNAYNTTLQSGTLTANNTLTLPNATGTLALTSDVTTAVLTATDDGAGNVTLSVTGVTSANLNSASGVSF